MAYAKNLNPNQTLAVRTTKGRLLVLAGAGSGKTGVIAHRIAYLIQEGGENPRSILGLTFTNKAAAEMRHRLTSLVGKERAKEVTLSTFHSFCMQILRKEIDKLGYTKDFSLYDEGDLHRVIKQIARDLLGHEGELPSLGPTIAALGKAANETSPTWHDPFSKDLYTRLQSTLRAYNAVSFDHLITLAIRLFETHPEVLDQYQERYRYLMIDEYQDTNPAQFRLAELLAAKYNNLCVVGDDDQSIYGWRGAKVENILTFKADTVVKLEQNYRSTSAILTAANGVISHNKNRHTKNLWSANPESEQVEVFHAPTEAEEASAIIQRIIHLRETKGLQWKEMAILYRSNALSRNFEMALMQAAWQYEGKWVRGIPYEIFGGLAFSERSEIKDLLAYLRTIANPLDQEALLRIVNLPRRGISDTLLDELTQENRSQNVPLWTLLEQVARGERALPGHPRAVTGITAFVRLIETAKRHFSSDPLHEALQWLLNEINYKKTIEDDVKSDKMREFKWENVQECVNALASYEEEEKEEASLQGFLSNTVLCKPSYDQFAKSTTENKVQLMTLHSAKGLEFPAVFISGVEDHILPHEKGMAETGLEEERRLFYVGITRAKKWLTLSMARARLKMGKAYPTTPSRFLSEIPKHLLKPVSHKFIA
jgi:superfamily I DNA/RNA helicase